MLVDHEDAMFASTVRNICDKIKQQPCIVVVYRFLEQQVYCKCLNNIQCDGPELRCRFKKNYYHTYCNGNNAFKKGKYIEILYNTYNNQMLCVTNVSYSTVT